MERFKFIKKDKISELATGPGVYAFKAGRKLLYIGKAANLKTRIKNHFQQPGYKDNLFIGKVRKVGFIETYSEIEALILEANLIKKYQPQFNVLWKDDKNYFFVAVTREDFPCLFITHQKKLPTTSYQLPTKFVGPFVDGKALKQTLRVLRRIFPFRSCKRIPKKACLWYQLKRCPAPCLLNLIRDSDNKQIPQSKQISKGGMGDLAFQIPQLRIKKECQENAKNLLRFLKGKKTEVLKKMEREMRRASKEKDFERAALLRDKILSFEKVLAHARVLKMERKDEWLEIEKALKKILRTRKEIKRVEAFDVSNIQGQQATGSMVTFIKGLPDKNFYRRFKIKITGKPDDTAQLKECLSRRFKHLEWGRPDLILIDGGKAQLNVAKKAVKGLKIRVISLAKGKKNVFIDNKKEPLPLKEVPDSLKFFILRLDDEAHRFAIQYHRKLRKKELIP